MEEKSVKVLSVMAACVGCAYCEAVCPTAAIRAHGKAILVEESCLAFTEPKGTSGKPACLICVSFCPVPGALEVVRDA